MDKQAMAKALTVEAVAATLIGGIVWSINSGFTDLISKAVGVLLAISMFLLLTYGIYTIFEDKSSGDHYGPTMGNN